MTIVGVAVVNDDFEAGPGRGGAVSPEFLNEAAPEVSGDPVIVRAAPGVDVDRLGESLQSAVGGPLHQVALRNVAASASSRRS